MFARWRRKTENPKLGPVYWKAFDYSVSYTGDARQQITVIDGEVDWL